MPLPLGTPEVLLLEELEDERLPTEEDERQLGLPTVELPLELDRRVERLLELDHRLGELLPPEQDRRRTVALPLRAATREEVGLRVQRHQPT